MDIMRQQQLIREINTHATKINAYIAELREVGIKITLRGPDFSSISRIYDIETLKVDKVGG